MTSQSLVFTGYGAAFPRHKVTNSMLVNLARSGMFTGVSPERFKDDERFKDYVAQHPNMQLDEAAFHYSVEGSGFHTRYHIAPYPAGRRLRSPAVDAAELGGLAVNEALEQARLTGEDIDAWVIGSYAVHGVPGIGPLVKEYCTRPGRIVPVRSLQGGCGTWVIALQMAQEMFATNPRLRHVVVAHTDVCSVHLYNQGDYVRPMLFGDGAAAVVLSRLPGLPEGTGLLATDSAVDLAFMGHVGVDMQNEFYHDPAEVKKVAVRGMASSVKALLHETGLGAADVQWLIPHQTGYGIIDKTARTLRIPLDRVHRGVNWEYGNISGGTVPAGLWHMERAGKFRPGDLVVGAAAGAGGEFGSFVYRMPPPLARAPRPGRLVGKRVLLTGASGEIGSAVLSELVREGAQVLAVRHQSPLTLADVPTLDLDMEAESSISEAVTALKAEGRKFDVLVHCAGASIQEAGNAMGQLGEGLTRLMAMNFSAPARLTMALCKAGLFGPWTSQVVYLGSAVEDYPAAGHSAFVASKRALHGWAASASSDLWRHDISSVYVQLGVVHGRRTAHLTEAQLQSACTDIHQKGPISVGEAARLLVQGLWAVKVPTGFDTQEKHMTVRRLAYTYESPLADR